MHSKTFIATNGGGLARAVGAGAHLALVPVDIEILNAMPLLVRHLRDWQIITAALAISGASYLLFPLVARVPLLMALSFALGIGLGCAQPTIMALLFNTAPRGRQGEVVGVRTFMLNASHTLIPLASGATSTLLGMAPVFWALAGCLLAGSWFIRTRTPRA